MKYAVMMTQEEYDDLMNQIAGLGADCYDFADKADRHYEWFQLERNRANKLWDLLNRPAIESAAQKHENDFYEWCSLMADKYEKLDEEAWMTERARWYNNGLAVYAEDHHLANVEEVDQERKYADLLTDPDDEPFSDWNYDQGFTSWCMFISNDYHFYLRKDVCDEKTFWKALRFEMMGRANNIYFERGYGHNNKERHIEWLYEKLEKTAE